MSCELTETVTIPEDYFIRSVWCAYANPRTAIFRELLQNSVDAKATEVRFSVTDSHLIVEDDGDGMSEEVIRPALLTLNGTYKRPDSVGGFGSAKEIILFAQSEYEIHTRDVLVKGCGSRYSLTRTEPRRGTRISLRLHPRFEFSRAVYIGIAQRYLSLCDVGARILLNGVPQPGLHIERIGAGLPWGTIRVKQLREGTSAHALVRVNGVLMFERWIGESKKLVCVDVEKPSVNILTSNRDSFTGSASDLIEGHFARMAIDKRTFGRETGERGIFRGAYSHYLLLKKSPERFERILRVMKDAQCRPYLAESAERAFAAGPDAKEYLGSIIDKTIDELRCGGRESDARQIEEIMAPADLSEDLEVSFAIHFGDYSRETLPSRYNPSRIGTRLRTLISLWRSAVTEVSRLALGENGALAFRVGWTFENAYGAPLAASYCNSDGVHTFLINPHASEWKGSPRKYLAHLIASAAHEFVHSAGRTCHDEHFATELTILNGRVLADPGVMSRVRAGAKKLQPEVTQEWR